MKKTKGLILSLVLFNLFQLYNINFLKDIDEIILCDEGFTGKNDNNANEQFNNIIVIKKQDKTLNKKSLKGKNYGSIGFINSFKDIIWQKPGSSYYQETRLEGTNTSETTSVLTFK